MPPLASPVTFAQAASAVPPASSPAAPAALRLNAASILRVLAVVATVLVVLHTLVVLTYLADWRLRGVERFYLDSEGNVPTWFASSLLLSAALVLGVIAAVKRSVRDPFRLHWLGLAALFVGLSIDEAASFHEALIKPLVSLLDLSGVLRFGWVLAGAAFVVAVFALYRHFLASLPARTRHLFLLSGGVYVLGAIGMEMIGGYYFIETHASGAVLVPYMLAMTLEETLEMAGILVFIHTLLCYLRDTAPAIALRLE